jgi:hypothetical protein
VAAKAGWEHNGIDLAVLKDVIPFSFSFFFFTGESSVPRRKMRG